jgi:hypothetical protein
MKRKTSSAPVPFKSWEEYHFSHWAQELFDQGAIIGWEYESHQFNLCKPLKSKWTEKLTTKEKVREQMVLRGHSYTPDFVLYLPEKLHPNFRHIFDETATSRHHGLWACTAPEGETVVYVEVKGALTTRLADGKEREARINAKWAAARFGVVINTAHIGARGKARGGKETLFEQTFTPARYLLTDKTLKPRLIHYEQRPVEEWLKNTN